MTNDELMIRHLLQRFMDGGTSIEEEKTLEQWFLTHQHVSPDLESYRQMFGWLGNGMPVADGHQPAVEPEAIDLRPIDKTVATGSSTHSRRWMRYAVAAAVAAIVVVAMSVFFQKGQQQTMPPSQGSGMPILTAQITQTADSIKAEVQADTISRPQPVKVRKSRRRSYRPYHPIMQVVDKPLIALSDSALQEADRQADAELAWMVAQQQDAFREMELAMEQNYAMIDMMLDEATDDTEDGYADIDNSF